MRDVNDGIRSLSLAGLIVLMATTSHTEEPRTPFRVTTRKTEDRVTVGIQGDRALFTVVSRSGIGGATITREGERWPGPLVIRLRLRGMERLQIGNGKVILAVSVASGGDHEPSLALSEVGEREVPIDRSSPYWMEVVIYDDQDRPAREIPAKAEVFEVILPHALSASNPPTITLDWIDFYR